MPADLVLSIFSPERRLLTRVPVSCVTLSGSEGQIQVLSGHANMVGTLETGAFEYVAESGELVLGFISTGFFEVSQNEVSVMAETLELKGEIDLDRAKRAQQKAEEMLRDAALDEYRFRKYELKLQRALIRQQLAGRSR